MKNFENFCSNTLKSKKLRIIFRNTRSKHLKDAKLCIYDQTELIRLEIL